MKKPLIFDDGDTYDRLMADIISINNVALLTAGALPDYLQTRLETSARGALKSLKELKK